MIVFSSHFFALQLLPSNALPAAGESMAAKTEESKTVVGIVVASLGVPNMSGARDV